MLHVTIRLRCIASSGGINRPIRVNRDFEVMPEEQKICVQTQASIEMVRAMDHRLHGVRGCNIVAQ